MTRYYRVRNSAYSAFRRANPHSANFTAYGSQYANFGAMDMLKNAYGAVKGAAKGAGQYIASAPGNIGDAVGAGLHRAGGALDLKGINSINNNADGFARNLGHLAHSVGSRTETLGRGIRDKAWARRAIGTGVLGLGTAGVAGAGYAGYRALNPRQAPMEEEMMEDPSMIDQYKQRAMNAYGSIRSRLSPQQPM